MTDGRGGAPPGRSSWRRRSPPTDAARARRCSTTSRATGCTGELYDLVADYPRRPGKGIRPALCLASCRAHGGRDEDALAAAVAIELLHNAFLVHDDICDDARLRRGARGAARAPRHPARAQRRRRAGLGGARPAARRVPRHSARGSPSTCWPSSTTWSGARSRATRSSSAWRERGLTGLDVDDYLRLVLDKTCWYSTIHPCRVGALLGSRGRADLEAIARFGFFLGAVLQIRDDVENVTDRAEAHGKDFGSDIIEGKPTLILIHLLRSAPPAARTRPCAWSAAAGVARRSDATSGSSAWWVSWRTTARSTTRARSRTGSLAPRWPSSTSATAGLPESPDKAFLRSLVLHLRDPAVRGR